MIVVADTTPLRHPIAIGRERLLPGLYGRILIPGAVKDELTRPTTPLVVRRWITNPPDWLEIVHLTSRPSESLRLGPGERETIALAGERRADLSIIDDSRAVAEARALGLTVAPTLAVLDAADRRGLIVDFEICLDQLLASGFRLSRELHESALERHWARSREV